MLLKIDRLTKVYDNGVKAIDNLSLELSSGMFGLLGPNGAGKSSLMRTIATLQEPDEGSIAFNGIDILTDKMSLRKQLGYLPQEFGVYPKVNADQLLDHFAILKGISNKQERKQIIDKVLYLTNLDDARKKHVSSYSGGMKQRFGIAQLLLNNPKLIIVDEPTAGLDPAERNRFLNVLREIGTNNIVIFSTHLVEDVKELCSNMAIMNKGKILLNDSPSSAIESINSRVWSTQRDKNQLPALEEKYQVLSSSYNDDNTLTVKVYAAQNPGENFNKTTPNLEDLYFKSLNDFS